MDIPKAFGLPPPASNAELFKLSEKIIKSKSRLNTGLFQEAYNLSYTDIYDYASKKQSLKKWEIELGLHHLELGLPWDKPVPESQWKMVSEYCDNDVISSEAVFNATQEDFTARKILVRMANILCKSKASTVNNTTNQLTERIIFRGDKNPQSQFLYTNLATGERSDGYHDECCFPGYVYENGKSTYLGEDIGEGGYVRAKPGMYQNVKTFDVASMHPSSAIAMQVFGPYTQNFSELKNFRVIVKHESWEDAKKAFNGALSEFVAEIIKEDQGPGLAFALKIAINSVYGLTAAHFENAFRDPRNIDNIVAKRGALFMCKLQHELEEKGANVVHIKTDSIKVANPTKAIENYILKRGKDFGYVFEVESVYERFCLVNDAVYVAKCSDDPANGDEANKWTATGAQFQVPYVFKKCFSHEPIVFEDLCETKEVKSALYLDMNESLVSNDEHIYEKLLDAIEASRVGSATKSQLKLLEQYPGITEKDISDKLASFHAYKFIGRVGLFTPIKPGCGGGELVREQLKKDGTIGFDSVVGTKGYRWLESEEVLKKKMQADVDYAYYNNLVNGAIETISEFGDYEQFVDSLDDELEEEL
jgi:hypothetical protein